MIDSTQNPPDILTDIEGGPVTYSTFWQRFFALLIDGLVLCPLIFIDTYNKTTWKSFPLLIISSLIALAYKPFMEAGYGATLGKMAMKLTIVNYEFQKAGVRNIILRNIIDIVNRVAVTIVTIITFVNPNFEDVNSLAQYNLLSNAAAYASWVTVGLSLLVLADAIVLLADSRRQALHDKIGQTFVIQK